VADTVFLVDLLALLPGKLRAVDAALAHVLMSRTVTKVRLTKATTLVLVLR
jgi:hypothetical protein